MKHGDKLPVDFGVEKAWLYVDLMFEQLEKRKLKDLDCKDNKDVESCTSVVEGFTVNWDNLPEWAEWFAIDETGDCYVYSYKPHVEDFYNYWADFNRSDDGRAERIGSVEDVKDWKNTLTKRPSL